MIEIEKPRIEAVDTAPAGTYGKFIVEPLERGYGTTLGNSLRRVLLSSLPGVAVTSVKIDVILHEFSTIEGVKEDVTEIILNIKGLTAKITGDGPKVVYIEAEGAGEVNAGSIKCDSEVEILNPEMHIATLGDGARLYMEITLNKGRGYVPAERNKQQMAPIIESLNADLKGKAIVRFVNVDNSALAEGYPISVIPTQLFIDSKGKPYVPSDSNPYSMNTYSAKDTGEHVFTTHEGTITREDLVAILTEMGMK
jgi:hypothetical protein